MKKVNLILTMILSTCLLFVDLGAEYSIMADTIEETDLDYDETYQDEEDNGEEEIESDDTEDNENDENEWIGEDEVLFEKYKKYTKEEFKKEYYPDGEDYDNDFVSHIMYAAICKKASNVNGFLIFDGILLDYKGDATEIRIPDNVTDIMGFEAKNIKKVTIPSGVSYIANSFHGKKTEEVKILKRNGKTLKLGYGCFHNLKSCNGIKLPNEISIGDNCFEGYRRTFKMTVPSTVKKIGEDCFNGPGDVRGVVKVSGNLKKIGSGSFYSTIVVCARGSYADKYCQTSNIEMARQYTPYFFRDNILICKGCVENLRFRDMGAKNVKISSSNNKIVKVSGGLTTGYKAKGLKEGTAKVKVVADGKVYVCKVKVIKKSVKNRAKQAVYNVTRNSMSNAEKASNLEYWLADNCYYDYQCYEQGVSRSKYGAWSEKSALLDGYAVCTGFAKAYKVLLDEAGIKNMLKNGTADGKGHVWNLVKVGKYWANVDPTWCMPLLSDKFYKKASHNWDSSLYPKATYNKATDYRLYL